MFDLRSSSLSRIVVLILTCLGAYGLNAQESTSATQAKKPIPVVKLPLNANGKQVKDARNAFLRHEIVVVEGATAKDMGRLLGLSLHTPKAPREDRVKPGETATASNDEASKEKVEGILRAIAVRTTPEGQFHAFYGFTSGIKPTEKSGWTNGFKKWVNKESGIKEDTAAATDASVSANSKKGALEDTGGGPDPNAWTHLSTTTNSMTSANQNTALLTATVYRLNSIDPTSDYYMVLTDAQDSPNFGGGWTMFQRAVVVEAQTQDGTNATLFDHGPTGTLTSTTVGFSVGVSISLLGPSVSATFSASWTQPSVITVDASTSSAARWSESFGLLTPVSTGTFLSHQSSIFVVPGDTTSLTITPALTALFQSVGGPDEIQFAAGPIDAEPPVFTATPISIVLAPGASTTLDVVASIPNSNQGLTWNISNNDNTWLSVPSGPFSTNQDLPIAVNPGTPVGTTGFITVDTDPPFAAKSVESGPIQVQVTVGNAQPSTTTLTSSVNPSNSGQNVMFIATVTSKVPGTPTGTITFRNNLTPLGPAVPLSNGQAMFSTSTLPGGLDSINAVYSGDGNFEGGQSLPLQQIVNGSGTGAALISPTTQQTSPYGAETLYLIRVFLSSNDPSLPAPTGFYTVNFAERTSGKTVLSFDTVAGGLISFAPPSDTFLHAGFYKLTLHYSGDSNYAPGDSSPLDMFIAPSSTSTALSTNVTSTSLGEPVTLTATVTSPTFKQITIIPTGSVQFFDGTQPLGIVNLSDGVASLTTHTLSAGAHKLTATFSGGTGPDGIGNFTSSTNTTNLNVQTNATQTSISATPNPSNFRDSITFQSRVTPQNNQELRVPTGLVSFKDGSTILGTVLLSNGLASFTTSTIPGGAHTITAQYVGDAVFQPDNSANYPLTVNPINSVTNLTISEPDPGVVYGEFVDLNATITDANNTTLVKEPGTVTFSYVKSDGSLQVLATVNVAQGKATFRTSALPAAQYNFLATYSGSNDFNPSKSNLHTFSVNPAATNTAINSPASGTSVNVGQPIVINFQVAVVQPGGGIISGESVTVQDPNFSDSTCSGKLTGTSSPFTGSCTITPQTSGTRQLRASFLALVNPNYLPSSSLVATVINVGPAAPGATLFSNLTPSQTIAQGSTGINLSGVISSAGPTYPPANENVSVTIGSISRSVNIGAKGAFVFNNFPTNTLAVGTYSITYSYGGDTNFKPASDATTTLTVNSSGQGATTTTITPSVQQCVTGIPFELTIQVSSAKGTPDGTVVLVRTNPDNTQTLIGSQLLASGMWAPAVNSPDNFPMTPGTYSFTATYQGNSNFNSSMGTLGNFKCTAAARK